MDLILENHFGMYIILFTGFIQGEYIRIFCGHKSFKNIRLPRFGPNTIFKKVIFNKCDPPKTTEGYLQILTKMWINVRAIEEFQIEDINTNDTYLNTTHIKNINVKRLFISFFDKETYTYVSTNFWKDVHAPFVSLDYVVVLPFPNASEIEEVLLSKGKSEGVFGGCSNLKILKVTQWEIAESSRNWLSNCTQLHTLSLKLMLPVSLKLILQGATSIKQLVIEDCNVIPTLKMSFFASATNLRQLYLSRNSIKFVQ